jgi:hypothetical protein
MRSRSNNLSPACDGHSHLHIGQTALIRTGAGSVSLFRDVGAINEALGSENLTYELFRTLDTINPDLAKLCSEAAMDSIFRAAD